MTDTTPFGVVYDLETTGINPLEDRIVTAFVGLMNESGELLQGKEYLVNPGVEIPAGAQAVHGISNEVAATGQDPADAVADMLSIIKLECATNGLPLIGANVSYDLSMLLAETQRHLPHASEAAEELLREISVVDTYVIDKKMDKWRRGSRKLIDTAAHYGVELSEEEAHGAPADAIAAGRIALALLRQYPQIAPPRLSFRELTRSQADWKKEQAASLQDYFRAKGGKPDAIVSGEWPLQTTKEAA